MESLRLKLFLAFAGVLTMSFVIGPAIASMMELELIIPAFLTFGSATVILISFMIWVSKVWIRSVAIRDLFAPGTTLRCVVIVLLLLIGYLFTLAIHLLRVPPDPISDAFHHHTATVSCFSWIATLPIPWLLYHLEGIVLIIQRPAIAASISLGFRCADVSGGFLIRYFIYLLTLSIAVLMLVFYDAGNFPNRHRRRRAHAA